MSAMSSDWITVPDHLRASLVKHAEYIDHIHQSHKIESAVDLSKDDFTLYPKVFGPTKEAKDAISEALKEGRSNGYAQSHGMQSLKTALAEKFAVDGCELTEKNVIIGLGVKHTVELSLAVLCNPGDNVLVPEFGDPTYELQADLRNIRAKKYSVNTMTGAVNLPSLKDLIDEKTKAILLANPSFPSGHVFTASQLQGILEIAMEHSLPIISDERYQCMVYSEESSLRLASLTEDVPILECGGLDSFCQSAGWKLGWVLLFDRHKALERQVMVSMENLSMRLLGAPVPIQSGVVTLMSHDLGTYHKQRNKTIQENADLVCRELAVISGILPLVPQSGPFCCFKVDFQLFTDVSDCNQFHEMLYQETSILVAHGNKCGLHGNWMRINLAVAPNILSAAIQEIKEFCKRHKL